MDKITIDRLYDIYNGRDEWYTYKFADIQSSNSYIMYFSHNFTGDLYGCFYMTSITNGLIIRLEEIRPAKVDKNTNKYHLIYET